MHSANQLYLGTDCVPAASASQGPRTRSWLQKPHPPPSSPASGKHAGLGALGGGARREGKRVPGAEVWLHAKLFKARILKGFLFSQPRKPKGVNPQWKLSMASVF